MQKFNIAIRSFRQVQDFVSAAMVQPFEILVGNDRQNINGKDFMGMFSLDYSRPVQVTACCSEDECVQFRKQVSDFLI